jgi:eukaryotic-like serine/threonine-protein kinase
VHSKLARVGSGIAAPRRVGHHPVRFGRYEVIALLGEGGMARAYLALTRGPFDATKLVVVKQIRPEIAGDDQFVEMFGNEARLALRLAHANVVQTFEVLLEAGNYLLVMEYLDGRSLGHILRKVGRESMPLAEHLWILTKVLAGLHYAHTLTDFDGTSLDIVHRDVSPANLFVTFDGDVKLLDFGIAKASSAIGTTRQGVIKGKLGYASPEQCLGKPVDGRADVYAVGVLLWEALARRRRAFGDTDLAVLQARVTNGEPPIEEVWPEVPPELAAISARALAIKPEDRYPTALAFQHDLQAYLAKWSPQTGSADVTKLLSHSFREERAAQTKLIRECVEAAGNAPDTVPQRANDAELRQSLPTLLSDAPDWDGSQSKIVGKLRSRWPAALVAGALVLCVGAWAALRNRDAGGPPPPGPSSAAVAPVAASSSAEAARGDVESPQPTSATTRTEPGDDPPRVGRPSPAGPSRPQAAARTPKATPKSGPAPKAQGTPGAFQPGMDLGSPEQPSVTRRIEEQDPYKK